MAEADQTNHAQASDSVMAAKVIVDLAGWESKVPQFRR